MQHETEYPYIAGRGGVDFGEIQRKLGSEEFFSGVIDGGSGRKLVVTVAPNYLEVSDAIQPDLVLSCGLSEDAALRFNIRTKVDKSSRHPDLYAEKFVDLAIGHFQFAQKIIGNWLMETNGSESTNFDSYMTQRRLGKPAEEAASCTWSGRVFGKYGFQVNGVKELPGNVEAEFVLAKS